MAKHKEAAAPAAPVVTTVKARVLTNCAYGRCNEVVELTEAEAAQGTAVGFIDCHPDAVAYAESLTD